MIHQEASLNEAEGSLKIPLGSTLSFWYRSKTTGRDTIAKISAGRNRNHFIALFDEDDVDFRIAMENSLEDRSICYNTRILEESYGYAVGPNRRCEIETLVSYGKKLHFIRQSGHDGKKLVSTTATNHGLSRHDASVMLSEIKFRVSISERKAYSIEARIDFDETISVKVNGSNSLADMKRIISTEINVDVDAEFTVHFKGLRLDDNVKTMEDLGIAENSIVHITGQTVVYNVEILPHKTFPVAISCLATVIQLKKEITRREGTPVNEQRLYCMGCKGRELHDDARILYGCVLRDLNRTIFLFSNMNSDSMDSKDGSDCTKTHECSPSSVFVVTMTHPSGQHVTVSVCDLDTIGELICKVQTVANSPSGNIECYKNGQHLEKFLPLIMFEMPAKTKEFAFTLKIMCCDKVHACAPGQVIFVKTITGKTISIPYCGMLSIREIKQKIRERGEHRGERMKLIFGGIQLEDDRILRDYGIQSHSTFHVILRLVGGVCGCRNGQLCEWHAKKDFELTFSERGAITFGNDSEQHFRKAHFIEDYSIPIEPFIVELRLAGLPLLH